MSGGSEVMGSGGGWVVGSGWGGAVWWEVVGFFTLRDCHESGSSQLAGLPRWVLAVSTFNMFSLPRVGGKPRCTTCPGALLL